MASFHSQRKIKQEGGKSRINGKLGMDWLKGKLRDMVRQQCESFASGDEKSLHEARVKIT